jgi:flagellar basal-body rod protein FlgF
MNEVLAISLTAMQADMARVDQVAMNLTNVLTPGYKRAIAVQSAVGASFSEHMSRAAATDAAAGTAAVTEIVRDTRAATLKSTGQSLDVALAGKGYFEVLTDNGPAYTRGGSFHVDARGRLVTAQGYPVMGTVGEITLANARPEISSAGLITAPGASPDAAPLGQLKVVEFDQDKKLERLGDGLVAAGGGMKQVSDPELQVRQGFLENSNVDSAREMTTLVETTRHFETMNKIVQGYDDMLGTAIRKLGETS